MQAKIPAELRDRVQPIDSLELFPGNPRRHDLPTIKTSLRKSGQYRAIIAQKSTRRIVAGNGTLTAARQLGWKEIAVDLVEMDDDTARRIVLVDNRANDLASYDDSELVALLDALPEFEGTGFDQRALDALVAKLDDSGEAEDQSDQLRSEWVILVSCQSEEQQTELLERFSDEGLECRAIVT